MEDQYVDSDTQSFGARPPGGDHSQCTARSSHVTRLRRGRTRPSQLPTAGRPGRRCGCVHLRRTSSRSSAEASVALRPVHVPETRTGHSKTRTGSETLAALQAIREALAGLVTGAAGLDVARRALRRVFESFTLHRYGPASAAILDADLAAGDWYIVPTVRADAILSPLVIGRGEKLSASPPINLSVVRRHPGAVSALGSACKSE
jgi:hypothetical protein